MQYGKTLKILICLLLIIPILNIDQASANTNYDHETLMQYEGYGKAMYESIVEQTTFITGQYTDNKEYVSNSIDQIKDYASFWYNEFAHPTSGCPNGSFGETVLCGYGNLFERGGAYFLTVGDWIKNLFNDYDTSINGEDNNSFNPYSTYFIHESSQTSGGTIKIIDGYMFTASIGEQIDTIRRDLGNMSFSRTYDSVNKTYDLEITFHLSGNKSLNLGKQQFAVESERNAERDRLIAFANGGASNFLNLVESLGVSIQVFNKQTNELTPRPNYVPSDSNIKKLNNYIKDNPVQLPVPQLKPQLVCPDGTKINMIVNGSTFLSQSGQVMQVNTDGTANVLEQTCNLNWQKPTIDYVDDKAAITDPDGNWLDLLTGEMLECMLTGDCKPSIPKDNEDVEPLDGSLLAYVKNAYDYATGVLKTATDGLKSLATGAKDLTGLFGTFFSWLPGEMVVLMSSGLGIVIGLRLFRK